MNAAKQALPFPSINSQSINKRMLIDGVDEEMDGRAPQRKGRQAHASQTTSFLSGPNPKRNESGMAAKRKY